MLLNAQVARLVICFASWLIQDKRQPKKMDWSMLEKTRLEVMFWMRWSTHEANSRKWMSSPKVNISWAATATMHQCNEVADFSIPTRSLQ